MNPLQRIKLWIGRVAMKAAGLTFVPQWLRHSFMSVAWDVLLKQGLKGNATAYACATLLARTFPEPELWPWRVTAEGEYERLPKHELRMKLQRPNGDMGEAELFAFCVVYAAIGGNVYLWKQRNNARQVIAWWPFHDGDMQPIPGITTEEGLVAYYVLDNGDGSHGSLLPDGQQRHDNLMGWAIPKTDIIHWKWMIDPEQPWRGIGALEAAINDSQVANEIRSYIYSLLKNDAKPPIVINLAEGEEYDEDKAERLRAQWLQRYGGNNRGTPAFLEFGMNVKELGFNLQQLEIDSLRDGPDAAICMGFGIHPSVVGALIGLKHSTYSNFEEARRALTEQTLIPLWRAFASEFEQSMRDERGYGPALRIRFDIDKVRALVENQTAVRTFALEAWNGGLLTRAAALQLLGMKSGPTDEVYKVGLTTMFLPAGETMVQGNGNGDGKGLVLWQRNGNPHSVQKNGDLRKGWESGAYVPQSSWEDFTAEDWAFVGTSGEWGVFMKDGYPMRDLKAFPQDDGGATSTTAPKNQIERQRTAVSGLREARVAALPGAERLMAGYFAAYGERALAAIEAEKALVPAGNGRLQTKELTETEVDLLAGLLFQQENAADLETAVKAVQLTVAEASWDVLNVVIDSAAQFSQNDPAVATLLQTAGQRVRNITSSTRAMLQSYLDQAYTAGWAIEDVANGRDGVPGIKDFVTETYKGRAEAIARTEIGTAQQVTAVQRYKAAGADGVIVFDNGFDNSHPTCVELDGTTQTLEWAAANPLQHPNCVRAFGAWFKD